MNPERKSGWARLFEVCSVLSFGIGLTILIFAEKQDYYVASIIAIVSGINGLFIGFLTQTFFECRNYLKRIDSKLSGSTEVNSLPKASSSDSHSTILLIAFLVVAIGFIVVIKLK